MLSSYVGRISEFVTDICGHSVHLVQLTNDTQIKSLRVSDVNRQQNGIPRRFIVVSWMLSVVPRFLSTSRVMTTQWFFIGMWPAGMFGCQSIQQGCPMHHGGSRFYSFPYFYNFNHSWRIIAEQHMYQHTYQEATSCTPI